MRKFAVQWVGLLSLWAIPRAAHGDVTWEARPYGFLNAQVERVEAKGGATPYDARLRITDGNSRVGVLGFLALTGNVRVVGQIEASLNGFEQAGFNDQGGAFSLVSRNTFVGVDDARFGRLIAGNVDSVYRSLVGSGGPVGGNLGLTVLGLDLWNNTSAQLSGNSNSLFGRGEARYQNSLHYISPAWHVRAEWATVQGGLSYSSDEAVRLGGHRDRMSAALYVRLGWLTVGGATDIQRNTGVDVDNLMQGFGLHTDAENGATTMFFKGLASVMLPTGTFVGVGFERAAYGYQMLVPPTPDVFYPRFRTGTMVQDGLMGSVAQVIGPATVMVSCGLLRPLDRPVYGRGADYQANQCSGGAKWAFNDKFMAYVFVSRIHNAALQDVNLGASLYTNGAGTSRASLAPGDSPNTVGVGAIARF